MKKILIQFVFIGSTLFLLPFFIVWVTGNLDVKLAYKLESRETGITEEQQVSLVETSRLIGILAKEVPSHYEMETLKAQGVICRTYLARRILGIETKGELTGYTEEEMKDLWGQDYASIYTTYKEAVEATGNEIILYNNEPIEAIYHRASGGFTRDAKEVYKLDIPYLVGVESSKDHVTKQVPLKKTEIIKLLEEKYPNILLEKNLETQIQIIEKDQAEYVKSLQIGNQIIEGEEFKNLLGLPSSCFKIFNQGEWLVFDVRGEGHGVGFSQNGANELAKEDKDYRELIRYYYTDVEIAQYNYKR
ncbi:hypothetical protein CS063_13500 [Sporanaerobium hydrogeniformans]|uniref:Uncharacterized protein n=1 Tax=Sporanaerobium hydrogeniformans TaxID=3072179 RepID=A0AC61D904_9FIRM|nr:SpoIID/LytB domain-containing protein [Sporanaerobium hydrogeniformans]PHV69849.1 hypothetical protein CS063_13500 [Sporanaerobium hydrogeniformans]